MLALGARSSGPITTMVTNAQRSSESLIGYDTNGKQAWSRAFSMRLYGLEVEPSAGNLFYWSRIGNGPNFAGANLYEASPDGSGEHLLESCNGDCTVYPLAVNAQGDRVTGTGQSEQVTVTVTLVNGKSWSITWTGGTSDPDPLIFAAAFDPDGNVILAGEGSNGSYQGHATYPGALVMKLDRSGKLLWLQQLAGTSRFDSVGTSAKGTVVALGSTDATTWGGKDVAAGLVLVTAEADGTPRWARSVPGSDASRLRLAVDPPGQAAVVAGTGCSGAMVTKFDLAGDLLWQRKIEPTECDERHDVLVSDVALSNHDVVIGGEYVGTVDFGSGAQAATTPQGFVMKLAK